MGGKKLWNRLCMGALGALALAAAVQAAPFEFKPLTPQRASTLQKDARHEYDLGLAALDKVNYESAVDHFMKATQAEPDNPWLRFSVVQLAVYLGDTRRATPMPYDTGMTAVQYYDLAMLNLKAVAESPRLNPREQQRAGQWYDTINELRQAVVERDAKRIQFGREIAKQYVKELYHTDQANADQAAKDARAGAKTGKPGAHSTTGLNPNSTNVGSGTSSSIMAGSSGQNITLRKEPDRNTGQTFDVQNQSPTQH